MGVAASRPGCAGARSCSLSPGKALAGWVTPGVFRMLELDPAEYSAGGRTCQAIRGFVVGREGGHAVQTRFPDVVSHGICRCEFDAFLLERSGARVDSGGPVRSIHRDAAGWVLDETYRAPLLIGAGGHFCPVARVLALAQARGNRRSLRRRSSIVSILPQRLCVPWTLSCRNSRSAGTYGGMVGVFGRETCSTLGSEGGGLRESDWGRMWRNSCRYWYVAAAFLGCRRDG